MDDVGGEPGVGELAVEDCFERVWMRVDKASGIEFRFNLDFVVVASRFELKYAEDVVAIHSV